MYVVSFETICFMQMSLAFAEIVLSLRHKQQLKLLR